jgi:ATPase subunit of ABC transporter with duplicated ATPase domains
VLVDRGFEKLVNEYDGKLAAEQKVGESIRPLTMVSIEGYLKDFGLEPEFATHSNIRGLSGGQKVKLVLASAMWSNPHMLIMDEPTNYLDRDSLGALAMSIKVRGHDSEMVQRGERCLRARCRER